MIDEEKSVEGAGQKEATAPAADSLDLEKQFPEFKGWEAIGFQRPLGQELWPVIIEQLNNALYVFIALYLIPIIRQACHVGDPPDLLQHRNVDLPHEPLQRFVEDSCFPVGHTTRFPASRGRWLKESRSRRRGSKSLSWSSNGRW